MPETSCGSEQQVLRCSRRAAPRGSEGLGVAPDCELTTAPAHARAPAIHAPRRLLRHLARLALSPPIHSGASRGGRRTDGSSRPPSSNCWSAQPLLAPTARWDAHSAIYRWHWIRPRPPPGARQDPRGYGSAVRCAQCVPSAGQTWTGAHDSAVGQGRGHGQRGQGGGPGWAGAQYTCSADSR